MKEDIKRFKRFVLLFKPCLPSYCISSMMVSCRNLIITWLTAFISSKIVDMVCTGKSTDLVPILFVFISLLLAFAVFDSFGLYYQSVTIHRICNMLRDRLYTRVLYTSIPDAERQGQRSELIMRINQDVDMASGFLGSGLIIPLMYLISGIGATIIVARESLLICAGMYCVGLIGILFQNRIAKKMREQALIMQQETSRGLETFMQTVSRSSDIKMANLGHYFLTSFHKIMMKFRKHVKKYSVFSGMAGGLSETIRFLAFGGVIGISLYFYFIGSMSLASVVMVSQMSSLITTMILSLASTLTDLHISLVGIERIFDIADLLGEDMSGYDFSSIIPQSTSLVSASKAGCQFTNGSRAFDDLTIDIPSNACIALCGESGCGKTTLLRIILKLYPYTSGSLKLVGEEITSLSAAAIREKVAYVPQENIIFSGTVRDNILIGNKNNSIHDEEILQVLAGIGASSFIDSLGSGLDTEISEGGQNLSGGQRQLLAITRAIMYKRPIMILDEAFAGIDTDHIISIIDYLKKLDHSKSVIVVTHDSQVAGRCDAVIHMQ